MALREGTWERINRTLRENALGFASKGPLSPAQEWWKGFVLKALPVHSAKVMD